MRRLGVLIGYAALMGVLIAALLASVNFAAFQIERFDFKPFEEVH